MKALLKRIVALLIVMLMLTSLMSCDVDISPDNSETKASGEESLSTGFPDCCGGWTGETDWKTFDFKGEVLKILVRNDAQAIREWGKEEPGDDELDLAIYSRNEVVEERLNLEIEIVPIEYSLSGDLHPAMIDLIRRDVDNKLHEYDIVAHYAYMANDPMLQGYQANLLDEELFPHFDFSLACWNQSVVKNCSVNGALYSVVGDLNTTLFDNAAVIWHNMDLYEQVSTENDADNIQRLVLDGKWTYSELYKWSSYYNAANTGDSCDSIYGISVPTGYGEPMIANAVPYAFELEFVKTNEDGTHSFNFVGNDKAEQVVRDWRALCDGDGNGHYVSGLDCRCFVENRWHFTDGNIIFKADTLFRNENYNKALREMNDRYALLPMPKYNEEQDEYRTAAVDDYTLMSVIDHSNSAVSVKGEAVSAYLQCATEYSYTHVRGYYLENVVRPVSLDADDFDDYDDYAEYQTQMVAAFVKVVDGVEFDIFSLYSSMLDGSIQTIWQYSLVWNKTLEEAYRESSPWCDSALKELDKWFGLTTE